MHQLASELEPQKIKFKTKVTHENTHLSIIDSKFRHNKEEKFESIREMKRG